MSKMKGAFITDLYSILRFRRKRSRLLEGSQNLLNSYLTDISFQTNTYSLSVGAFSYGLSNLSVKAWGGVGNSISIGRFCSIAGNFTIILGGNHRMDWITTYPFGYIHNEIFQENPNPETIYSKGDVIIGNDVWIGENVTLLSGVTIGNGAIIGGCTVVTKSVGAYRIVVGNPGREVGSRFTEEIIRKLEKLAWWDLDSDQINSIIRHLQTVPKLETIEVLQTLKITES